MTNNTSLFTFIIATCIFALCTFVDAQTTATNGTISANVVYNKIFDYSALNNQNAVFYAQIAITSTIINGRSGVPIVNRTQQPEVYEHIQEIFKLPVDIQVAYEMHPNASNICQYKALQSRKAFERDIETYHQQHSHHSNNYPSLLNNFNFFGINNNNEQFKHQQYGINNDNTNLTYVLPDIRDDYYNKINTTQSAEKLTTLISIKNYNHPLIDDENKQKNVYGDNAHLPKYLQSPTSHHISNLYYYKQYNMFYTIPLRLENGLDEMNWYYENKYKSGLSNDPKYIDTFSQGSSNHPDYINNPLNFTYSAQRYLHLTLPLDNFNFLYFNQTSQDEKQYPFIYSVYLTFWNETTPITLSLHVQMDAGNTKHYTTHTTGNNAMTIAKNDVTPDGRIAFFKAQFPHSYAIELQQEQNQQQQEFQDPYKKQLNMNPTSNSMLDTTIPPNNDHNHTRGIDLPTNNYNDDIIYTSFSLYDPRSTIMPDSNPTCKAYYYVRECKETEECDSDGDCRKRRTCSDVRYTNSLVQFQFWDCNEVSCLWRVNGARYIDRNLRPYVHCGSFQRYNAYQSHKNKDEHLYNDITYDYTLQYDFNEEEKQEQRHHQYHHQQQQGLHQFNNNNDKNTIIINKFNTPLPSSLLPPSTIVQQQEQQLPILRGWLWFTHYEKMHSLVQQKTFTIIDSQNGRVVYHRAFGRLYNDIPNPGGIDLFTVLLIIGLVVLSMVLAFTVVFLIQQRRNHIRCWWRKSYDNTKLLVDGDTRTKSDDTDIDDLQTPGNNNNNQPTFSPCDDFSYNQYNPSAPVVDWATVTSINENPIYSTNNNGSTTTNYYYHQLNVKENNKDESPQPYYIPPAIPSQPSQQQQQYNTGVSDYPRAPRGNDCQPGIELNKF